MAVRKLRLIQRQQTYLSSGENKFAGKGTSRLGKQKEGTVKLKLFNSLLCQSMPLKKIPLVEPKSHSRRKL
ncbi:hypothetical protein FRX31_030711 [Thalictrum thalictroides]|uniref:Uncharacterized protein n=1 Tax=Thalictrum thalictroides TaxID=46969 RepID=A0A7J6V4I2_THATH|nr:hypothetical protein FRX31_030711 [Thalictrum thalictroides]